jgi:predicted RND superfamily exporter protein
MPNAAQRYVAWIERHASEILIAAVIAVGAAAYLAAFHLPLKADFSYLLPGDAPSVKAAAQLAARVPAQDTMLLLVVAPSEKLRAAAADQAVAGIEKLEADLIDRVESNDTELRDFIGAHRHLFVPLGELETARDALASYIRDAKLRANPLFIDLEERSESGPLHSGLGDADPAPRASLDELRARQRDAAALLAKPTYISADGKTQVIVIRTSFRATDVERDLRLMRSLDALVGQIQRDHPGVTMGFAGGPVVTVAEHGALTRGIMLSSLITLVLVALVLFVYLRSIRILVLLTVNIVAATLMAIGLAAVTVGHLNAATAFLGAIIAGNGVNYGILLIARYLEERRSAEPGPALGAALAGTLRPTLVASLGAAIAYAALGATHFRGFADFAWIGGLGMLVCWLCSYIVLPALILKYSRTPKRESSAVFGRFVVRVFGLRRPALVCALACATTVGAGLVTWSYATNDPFEYDLTQLRSQAPDAVRARDWLAVSDATFGRGLAGLAGNTYVAVERADRIPAVVKALKATAAHDPIVGPVASLLDVVPPDQTAKLAVLGELRAQIDEALTMVEGTERDELLALRPADDLAAITVATLPSGLAAKLTERDGRTGLIVAVRPGASFDERDGRDLIAFAGALRDADIGDDVTIAGASVMFADVLTQIQKDGPLVTAIAIAGLVVMVLLVSGRSRRSYAVLAATGAGSLAMIAVCALAGLKINFLDFVALPITLGLGIDYAINIADRAATSDPLVALRSTGSSVVVCSLTTVIGYGSLLVSDNLAIRGFGLASLIGEITCLLAALVIVPAIIALPSRATELVSAGASYPSRA